MQELIEKIEQWARDRELDKKGTVEEQKIKTADEMAELIEAISKDNIEDIKDSIGDVFVALVIGSMLENYNIEELVVDITVDEDIAEEVRKTIEKSEKIQLEYKTEIIFDLANDIGYLFVGNYEDNAKGVYMSILKTIIYYNLDFQECVQGAYEEIKNRKGEMINGTFVKEVEHVCTGCKGDTVQELQRED